MDSFEFDTAEQAKVVATLEEIAAAGEDGFEPIEELGEFDTKVPVHEIVS